MTWIVLPLPAAGEIGDMVADGVSGQSSFADSEALTIDAGTFARPSGVAVDPDPVRNRVYVSDSVHQRVLGWSNADSLANGAPASIVIGQTDFFSWGCNGSSGSGYPRPAPTLSTLCEPHGLAVDDAGNLYVADRGNCRLLVFYDPFATDTTADLVLGTGCSGSGVTADRIGPSAVAVDTAYNVFVADEYNLRVLEYDGPLWSTDTTPDRVFGQPDFTTRNYSGSVYFPKSVSVDGAGNLYVGSQAYVYIFTAALGSDPGVDRQLGGSCNSGGETASTLCHPVGVAADVAGRLYVADLANNRVLEFDSPLTISQAARVFGQPDFWGTGGFCSDSCNTGGASASSLCLYHPTVTPTDCFYDGIAAVTLDSSGRLWVADGLNHRVLRYDSPLSSDGVADFVLGQPSMNSVRQPLVPFTPGDVEINNYYASVVVDTAGSRILVYPGRGRYRVELPSVVMGQPDFHTTGCNTGGVSASSLCNPTGSTVDRHGHLWIADTGNNRVLQFQMPWYWYDYDARQYVVKTAADRVFGQPDFVSSACGLGASGLCGPRGVAADYNDMLYISDAGNNRIVHHMNPLGDTVAERVYGQPNFDSRDCTPGAAGAASVCNPRDIAVFSDVDPWGIDQGDDLYVADYGNNRVLMFETMLGKTTGAAADRVFGQGGNMNTAACSAGAGGLCGPSDISFDSGNNMYVADTGNSRVLVYRTPLGTDTDADVVFGQPDFTTTGCNTGGVSAESLCLPESLIVYTAYEGALLVGDTGNKRVLIYDAPICVVDFQLTSANRRNKTIRSRPKRTSLRIQLGANPSVADDTLLFSGKVVLLEDDGGIDAGDSPKFTLWTDSGIVLEESVPNWVSNDRATANGGVWSTGGDLEADTGITWYKVVTNFYIPPGFSDDPQRDRVGYRGRAVNMDLGSFTDSSAWWRMQYGGVCMTTELKCTGQAGGDRECHAAPARRR